MGFKVPERARVTDHPVLGTSPHAGNFGHFDLESTNHGWRLAIIASDGQAIAEVKNWEHVSVHAYRIGLRHRVQLRTPSWEEMAFVRGLFWDDEDVVMQLHPRRSEYVNMHPHTLHLWRHAKIPIPTPPKSLV